jgi:hypothetical protein
MLPRTAFAFVLLAVFTAIACQSKDENGQDQYTLLDDMEPRDADTDFRWGNGCVGQWRTSVGGGESDRVWTRILDELSPSQQTLRGDWSTRAAHLYTLQPLTAAETDLLADAGTTAFSADAGATGRPWGANMNVDLMKQSSICSVGLDAGAEGEPLPADLSAYSGLVFWAKASNLDAGVGEQTIHLMVHDWRSDDRANQCNVNGPNKDKDKDCYNGFSLPLNLSNTFTRYEVDFSDLLQDPTWGYLPEVAFDLTCVYQILFEVRTPKCVLDRNARCMEGDPQTLQFDFWIDDLYLVKHPAK